jgi:Subtilase family
MGHPEAGLVDLGVPVEQQVEVQGARPLRRNLVPPTPEAKLDGEQPVEQLPRRQLGLERGGAVEEPRLVDVADRLRVVEVGDGDAVDSRLGGKCNDGRTQRLLAVAEVRAEGDVGAGHGPRLSLRWLDVGSRVAMAFAAIVAALGLTGTGAAATGRISDEPLQAQEWWLHDVGADQATPPGPGVPLAFIDSGLDVTTPEFAGRPNITLMNSQTVFGPEEWHGTFVASIAAAPVNGVGIVGVYPQAALEIWDASPISNIVSFSAAQGIETAAQHCPTVISLSFGSLSPSTLIAQAVDYAQHQGCLVVASAGNDGEHGSPPSYPAAQAHVLTVAATEQDDTVASFSTSSPANDLAAPGDNMTGAVPLTKDPSGFLANEGGTSFSTPIVSAAAAWVWTMRPSLDWTQLAEVLRTSARDVGPAGFDPDTGFGILDIPAALAAPTPQRDPLEPNDDIDEVKPGAMFRDGLPAITTVAKPSVRLAATLDENEDPRDLYRIWVPAHQIVRVSTASAGNAAARIWGPQTISVGENVAARRRDLKGPSMSGGSHGSAAYVEVLPTGKAVRTSYVLTVRASRS